MQIGRVIRKYRKEKNMTQEEMTKCLGVSTPAVNKWENENSSPDISLLCPIARLLDISLEELLNFENELSEKDINKIITIFEKIFYKGTLDAAVEWIKEQLKEYPKCYELMYKAANMIFMQLFMQNMVAREDFDEFMIDCYTKVLPVLVGKDKEQVAFQMVGIYMLRKKYDEAILCLEYLSDDSLKKQMRLANIYSAIGKTEEAFAIYEDMLSTTYTYMDFAIQGLSGMYRKKLNIDYSGKLAYKRHALADLLEIGKYHQMVTDFEYLEQDSEYCEGLGYSMNLEELENCIKKNVGGMMDMRKSFLYKHLPIKELSEEEKNRFISIKK